MKNLHEVFAKNKKAVIITVVALIIAAALGGMFAYPKIKLNMAEKKYQENLTRIADKISLDNGGYISTSTPLGLSDFKLYGGNLDVTIYKNSNSPWVSKVYIKLQFLDENNNLLDEKEYSSGYNTLLEGSRYNLETPIYDMTGDDFILNGKPVRNIKVVSLREEDALNEFKDSKFTSHRTELERMLESGDEAGFYTKLEYCFSEYPQDIFPDKYQILVSLEAKANEKFGKSTSYAAAAPTSAPTAAPTPNPAPEQTQAQQNSNSSGGNSSSGLMDKNNSGEVALNGFTVISHESNGNTVTGIIRNDTGEEAEDVYIEFSFYDANGVKLDYEGDAFVENLHPNTQAHFELDEYEIPDGAAYYEIIDIDTF